MKNTLGTRIKKRREELGLTQTELAERLGLKSKVSVSNAENDRDDMTTTRLVKYAEALDTSVAYLMGWLDIPYSASKEAYEIIDNMIELYALKGYKPYHILDIVDRLPSAGVDEVYNFCDFVADRYGVSNFYTKEQIDKAFIQREIRRAQKGL